MIDHRHDSSLSRWSLQHNRSQSKHQQTTESGEIHWGKILREDIRQLASSINTHHSDSSITNKLNQVEETGPNVLRPTRASSGRSRPRNCSFVILEQSNRPNFETQLRQHIHEANDIPGALRGAHKLSFSRTQRSHGLAFAEPIDRSTSNQDYSPRH
jgi:hypothetical protein